MTTDIVDVLRTLGYAGGGGRWRLSGAGGEVQVAADDRGRLTVAGGAAGAADPAWRHRMDAGYTAGMARTLLATAAAWAATGASAVPPAG